MKWVYVLVLSFTWLFETDIEHMFSISWTNIQTIWGQAVFLHLFPLAYNASFINIIPWT